jgi:hypothetical protein
MSPVRYQWRTAILLSLCTLSEAWVLHRKADSRKQEADNVTPIELRRHEVRKLGLEKRQTTELVCREDDDYEELLDNNPEPFVQFFCNRLLGLGPATTVVEVTPTR